MPFGSSLRMEFLKSGSVLPQILSHRAVQNGRVNKVLVECTLIPLFLHHPTVARIFTRIWHSCCFSIKRSAGLGLGASLLHFNQWSLALFFIGNAILWFFFNSLLLGLANCLFGIFVSVYLVKNYLQCKVSVRVCFYFLCWKRLLFFFFLIG